MDQTNMLHKIRHFRTKNEIHPLKLGDNCVSCITSTSMCIGHIPISVLTSGLDATLHTRLNYN